VLRFTVCTLSAHIVDAAIKDNEVDGICDITGLGGEMKYIQNLILKPERTGPLGRPRCVWEGDTI